MKYNKALSFIESLEGSSVYVTGEANTKRILIEAILRNVLGYSEAEDIVMEYVADVGIRAGEKVDYVLKVNGEDRVLVEAKDIQEDIGKGHLTQLYRYFATTDAEVGILTNGVEWQIYTDTKKANIMDLEPIHTVYLNNYTEVDNAVFESISKGTYSKERLLGIYRERENLAEQEQTERMREYEASEEVHKYINSSLFYNDVIRRCNLSDFSDEKIQEIVKGVLSGSYVLTYAKEAQIKKSKEQGRRLINLVEADSSPEILGALSISKVQYTTINREEGIADVRELPYVVLNLIKVSVPYSYFEEVMRKQVRVKKWIHEYDSTSMLEIGRRRVNDYEVDNAGTPKEAIKRSVQMIKAFKLNPIWFVLEERVS